MQEREKTCEGERERERSRERTHVYVCVVDIHCVNILLCIAP